MSEGKELFTANTVTAHGLFANVRDWSEETFGTREERDGTGALKHILKEIAIELLGFENAGEMTLNEILSTPAPMLGRKKDLEEFADVEILLNDATWREGYTHYQRIEAGQIKMLKNRTRSYAKPAPGSDAISEHDRTLDGAVAQLRRAIEPLRDDLRAVEDERLREHNDEMNGGLKKAA